VNKVFISGSVGADPQVSYTPKGQKIVMFPIWVEEGGFSIDVIFAGGPVTSELATTIGKRVLVAGAIAKTKTQSRDVLKVKASKILPMEE
jgi:single-stranded DNA-binding protein